VPTYFALSWYLTWFAHDVEDHSRRARIFDVCLASPPEMPVYFAAAVRPRARHAQGLPSHANPRPAESRRLRRQLLLTHRDELLGLPCESDLLHSTLGKLGRSAWNVEATAARALALLEAHPFHTLEPPKAAAAAAAGADRAGVAAKVLRVAVPMSAALVSVSAALLYYWVENHTF